MHSSGKDLDQIAMELGRTKKAIHARLWTLGLLVSREWTDEQIKILTDGYSQGKVLNIEELCRMTGKTKAAVHLKASRLGLGDWSRKKVEERKIRIPKYKDDKSRKAAVSERIKKYINTVGHPKGMLGKRHTDEAKALIAESSTRINAARTEEQKIKYKVKALKTKLERGTYATQRPHTTWKAGWREIGGVNKYYRSRWEANYARYLEWLKGIGQISGWAHEPQVFWFDGVKRGCVSYLPDFKVIENDGSEAFHEVKGWMDDRSKTKIRRMAKYHPGVRLIVIDAKAYEAIRKKVQPIIKEWE